MLTRLDSGGGGALGSRSCCRALRRADGSRADCDPCSGGTLTAAPNTHASMATEGTCPGVAVKLSPWLPRGGSRGLSTDGSHMLQLSVLEWQSRQPSLVSAVKSEALSSCAMGSAHVRFSDSEVGQNGRLRVRLKSSLPNGAQGAMQSERFSTSTSVDRPAIWLEARAPGR